MTHNPPSNESRRAVLPKRCHARRKGASMSADGLYDEIAILRMLVRRVSALVDDGGTLSDQLRLLDVTSMAISRLAKIIKTEHSLDEGTNIRSLINRVIAEAASDMGLGDAPDDSKGSGIE